ncbi:MAG: response regulator [Nitrospirae bacterium]|nr:response regulator [Nitrospirota bacterium]
MEKKKILIVEDEGVVALTIKKDLELMEYEVVDIFASGEEAIEGIKAANPDLILMDIKLQGKMDGIETANDISKQYDVPVIYLTAHSEEETLRRAKKTEPYGYLLKPVNEKELHTAVEIALYKHNLDCKLRESEEQYRLLAENMGDVIWKFNIITGRFTFVSPSVQKMRGLTPWQAMQQTMKATLSPKSYKMFMEGLRSRLIAFAAGDIFSTRIQTHYLEQVHQNGSLVPTEVVTTLLSNEEGRATELLGVSRDITQRKQMEESLKKVSEELKQSNEALEQFARDASHDLQEPLISVGAALKLLKRKNKDALNAEAEDYINQSMDQITHMQTLIKELLDFARIGTRKKNFELTDCSTILDRALANLKGSIEKNEVTVTRDYLPEIMCNSTQMTRLFQNLISNAIKFCGKEPLLIHVSAERKGKEWAFSVRDNGIGIETKDIENVFKVFHRFHHKEELTGSGIGLATCKKVVELHGGSIWVESKPNNGSTFYFTIPDGTD